MLLASAGLKALGLVLYTGLLRTFFSYERKFIEPQVLYEIEGWEGFLRHWIREIHLVQ